MSQLDPETQFIQDFISNLGTMETENSNPNLDDTNSNREEEMDGMNSTATTTTATTTTTTTSTTTTTTATTTTTITTTTITTTTITTTTTTATATIDEDDYDFPFSKLPAEVLAHIIDRIPVAQWSSLELLDKNFRFLAATAWAQLRCVNVSRELLTPPDVVIQYYRSTPDERSRSRNHADRSPFCTDLKSILQNLVERSPKLSSLSGVDIHLVQDADLILDMLLHSLAQFEHLRSITLGDTQSHIVLGERGIQLETVVDFLKSTRSRPSLKEIRISNVVQGLPNRAAILDRFDMSFVNGRNIHLPLKLEKFSISSPDKSLFIRLDHMDSTRLTDIRLGNASIEPEQLSNLIERAPNLRWVELSFLRCDGDCNGPRLQANVELLQALASLENLATMKLNVRGESKIGDPCVNFGSEFIEMLKTIGRRGELRKLAVVELLRHLANKDEVCAAICNYLPYLQSIKINGGVSDQSIDNIVSLKTLEQIDLPYLPSTAVQKASQLPHLKRLATSFLRDPISLTYLVNATALTDLRLMDPPDDISADVFEKWSNGFAANLEILMVGRRLRVPPAVIDGFKKGLVRLLEKAVRLRVLIIYGVADTSTSLIAVANSCPNLEILGVDALSVRRLLQLPVPRCVKILTNSRWTEIVRHLQEIVDRCPKLRRLGGIGDDIRDALKFPKYRNVGDVDTAFTKYDFDDTEYD